MTDNTSTPQTPVQDDAKKGYYTLSTLRSVTTAAMAITFTCGLIMNVYKQGTKHEISLIIINLIALVLCILVVIANQFKKEAGMNGLQYSLLIFFNLALLYASVIGATGLTANFMNAQTDSAASAKAKASSVFSFLIPTRPLYGVSQNVYTTTKNSLASANQQIDIVQKRNDTLVYAVVEANRSNIKKSPDDTRIEIVKDTVIPVNGKSEEDQAWVYLGQIINQKWQPQNFDFKGLPIAGDGIIANKTVFKRDAAPLITRDEEWKLGAITGVVASGQKIKIISVYRCEGENYWAKIEQ